MNKYIKFVLYLYVLVGFSYTFSGSYEDFFTAIARDDPAAIRKLLSRGFDPNTRNPDGQHGLMLAVRQPAPAVAQLLINTPRIDLEARNQADETALMLAALHGQAELAKQLVEKGADINKPGWTPLHYAATSGRLEILRLLLEEHAYVDAASPNGSTPLMMAAMYGSASAVKVLLEAGADPMLTNQQGLSALDFAQRANQPDSADLIAAFARGQQQRSAP